MRPVLAILAAAVAAAAAPAVAGAADVDRPFGLDRVDVTAAPGEANQVRVTDDGTGFVLIRDVVKLTETTPSCVSVSTLEVRCSAGSSTAVLVKPGDRDNRIEVVTRRQTESAKTRRRTQPGRFSNDAEEGDRDLPSSTRREARARTSSADSTVAPGQTRSTAVIA
jgi:hypothetical protein